MKEVQGRYLSVASARTTLVGIVVTKLARREADETDTSDSTTLDPSLSQQTSSRCLSTSCGRIKLRVNEPQHGGRCSTRARRIARLI